MTTEQKIKEAFEVYAFHSAEELEVPYSDFKAGYMACLNSTEDHNDTDRLDYMLNSGRIVICDRDGCYTYNHTSGRYGPVAKDPREAIDLAMKESL